MSKLLESKENKLAATYNIQPVSCEKIELRKRQPEIKLTPDLVPEFHYPLYPLMGPNEHTTPQKKMFFLENEEHRKEELANRNNQSDDIKNSLSKMLPNAVDNGFADIPDVKKVPDYMNIPNLWNVQLIQPDAEKEQDDKDIESSHPESSGSSSEWELV